MRYDRSSENTFGGVRAANDNAIPVVEGIHLPPLVLAAARRNGPADLLLTVEEGVVEVMVGGASGFLATGSFVRVPAGATYAYRNVGREAARLVSRTVSVGGAATTAA